MIFNKKIKKPLFLMIKIYTLLFNLKVFLPDFIDSLSVAAYIPLQVEESGKKWGKFPF